MDINPIAVAMPFMMLFITMEVLYSWYRGQQVYRFAIAVADLSAALTQRASTIVTAGVLLAPYWLLYENARLFDFDNNSVVMHIMAFLGYDLMYYWWHRMTHETSLGTTIEARWRHDGTWRLVSASPELEFVAERFRELWNGRDLEALAIGLIFFPAAVGVYLTFRVLDFPDLTVDASFPAGGAIAAGASEAATSAGAAGSGASGACAAVALYGSINAATCLRVNGPNR